MYEVFNKSDRKQKFNLNSGKAIRIPSRQAEQVLDDERNSPELIGAERSGILRVTKVTASTPKAGSPKKNKQEGKE